MSGRGLRMGDRVTLHYRLSCAGREMASTFGGSPETFTLGQGEMDPRLEVCLLGLEAGQRRHLSLGPGQAFGERSEALVQRLERKLFDPGMELGVGYRVDFSLPNGQVLHGTILDLDDTQVVVDFNHPLAGLPVEFEVYVLAVE